MSLDHLLSRISFNRCYEPEDTVVVVVVVGGGPYLASDACPGQLDSTTGGALLVHPPLGPASQLAPNQIRERTPLFHYKSNKNKPFLLSCLSANSAQLGGSLRVLAVSDGTGSRQSSLAKLG